MIMTVVVVVVVVVVVLLFDDIQQYVAYIITLSISPEY